MNTSSLPKLYAEWAEWWPVLSAPEEYAEASEFFRRHIMETAEQPPRTLLELGCGGGNNASHLKKHFNLTLTDIAPAMLDVSRALNPECEHLEGDMRTLRLDRTFDAVLIADAICYMTTLDDLRAAIATAFVHCRPGGSALFVPDHIKDTFRPSTRHGGHDKDDRALRYLEWTFDPNPGDSQYVSHIAYLTRDPLGQMELHHDCHRLGLFSREEWLRVIESAGFVARCVPFDSTDDGPEAAWVFVAAKPQA